MKRSPLTRNTPLQRSGNMRQRRQVPRRRPTPRWTAQEWVEANQTLLARSGGLCERCGKGDRIMERHHRKRRRDGGDTLANIAYLCQTCHQLSHAHPAEARRFGWIVSVTADPGSTPMLLWDHTWVQLDDDGGSTPVFHVPE